MYVFLFGCVYACVCVTRFLCMYFYPGVFMRVCLRLFCVCNFDLYLCSFVFVYVFLC